MPDQGTTTSRLPLFPLGTVLFPEMPLPLHVFEDRYQRMLREHEGDDPIFGVVLTRRGREVGDRPEIHDVGTAASLVVAQRYPDGRSDILVRGQRRFRVLDGDWTNAYLTGTVRWLDDPPGDADALVLLVERVRQRFSALLDAVDVELGVDGPRFDLEPDPRRLGYDTVARLPLDTWERQRLLEIDTTSDRLKALAAILERERALLLQAGAAGATLDRPGTGFSAN